MPRPLQLFFSFALVFVVAAFIVATPSTVSAMPRRRREEEDSDQDIPTPPNEAEAEIRDIAKEDAWWWIVGFFEADGSISSTTSTRLEIKFCQAQRYGWSEAMAESALKFIMSFFKTPLHHINTTYHTQKNDTNVPYCVETKHRYAMTDLATCTHFVKNVERRLQSDYRRKQMKDARENAAATNPTAYKHSPEAMFGNYVNELSSLSSKQFWLYFMGLIEGDGSFYNEYNTCQNLYMDYRIALDQQKGKGIEFLNKLCTEIRRRLKIDSGYGSGSVREPGKLTFSHEVSVKIVEKFQEIGGCVSQYGQERMREMIDNHTLCMDKQAELGSEEFQSWKEDYEAKRLENKKEAYEVKQAYDLQEVKELRKNKDKFAEKKKNELANPDLYLKHV